jgi:hypothetical protein
MGTSYPRALVSRQIVAKPNEWGRGIALESDAPVSRQNVAKPNGGRITLAHYVLAPAIEPRFSRPPLVEIFEEVGRASWVPELNPIPILLDSRKRRSNKPKRARLR